MLPRHRLDSVLIMHADVFPYQALIVCVCVCGGVGGWCVRASVRACVCLRAQCACMTHAFAEAGIDVFAISRFLSGACSAARRRCQRATLSADAGRGVGAAVLIGLQMPRCCGRVPVPARAREIVCACEAHANAHRSVCGTSTQISSSFTCQTFRNPNF